MTSLPVVSGKQTIAALERIGYVVVRQRGSHVRMRHLTEPERKPLTVPDHKELKSGTLRAILRDAGISPTEFMRLLAK